MKMSLEALGYYNNDNLSELDKLKLSYIVLLNDEQTQKLLLNKFFITNQIIVLEDLFRKQFIKSEYVNEQPREYLRELMSDCKKQNQQITTMLGEFVGRIDFSQFNNPDNARLLFYYIVEFNKDKLNLKTLNGGLNKKQVKNYLRQITPFYSDYSDLSINYYLGRKLDNEYDLVEKEQAFHKRLFEFVTLFSEYLNFMYVLAFILKMDGKELFFTSTHQDLVSSANSFVRDYLAREGRSLGIDHKQHYHFYCENEDVYNLKGFFEASKSIKLYAEASAPLLSVFHFYKKGWLFKRDYKPEDFSALHHHSLKLCV